MEQKGNSGAGIGLVPRTVLQVNFACSSSHPRFSLHIRDRIAETKSFTFCRLAEHCLVDLVYSASRAGDAVQFRTGGRLTEGKFEVSLSFGSPTGWSLKAGSRS